MKKMVAVLVILGLLAAGLLVLYAGRASAATTRTGGWVDQIVWSTQPSDSVATQQLDAGTLNMWMYYYKSVTALQAAQSDTNLGLINVPGSIDDMLFNPSPFTGTAASTLYNPFSVTEVRTAMEYLFDRSYISREIFGGAAFPQTALESSQSPEYARDPAFFAGLEAQYSYNFATAQAMVTQGLTGVPNVAFTGGQWQYKGSQIVLTLYARTEDQRHQIGDYVASQLRLLGFGVNEQVVTGQTAFNVVYYGPANTGAWNLYTEGFAATTLTAWADSDPYYYYCGGQGDPSFSSNGGLYTPPATLTDACSKLLNAKYTSVADRQSLFETAASEGAQQGVRVFLLAGATYPYGKKTMAPPVYDLAGGPYSYYTTRSAQLLDSSGNPMVGGTLKVGNRLNFVSDWNPWAPSGFSFIYDVLPEFDFADFGVWFDPHTGTGIPIRAAFQVTTAGPTGSMPVNASAYWFDASYDKVTSSYNNTWKTVGAGVTATSEVVFNYTFGTWHDGAPLTMADVLYGVSLLFRRVGPPAYPIGGDIYAQDNQAANYPAQLFASSFKGLQVLDSTHLAIYLNYWHVDPTQIAYTADVFPILSWDESELAMYTVLHGNTKVEANTAATVGLASLDLSKGPTITFMDHEISNGNVTTGGPTATVPAGFGPTSPFAISAADAATRWQDLRAFRNTTATYFSSNGPYMIGPNGIDTVGGNIVLNRFANYPFTADHWSSFIVPVIPTTTLKGPAQVLLGLPATFNLTSTFNGNPYNNVSVVYLVLNPATASVALTGNAVNTGNGAWAVELNGAQTTSLAPGAYTVETVTVGELAAVPVFSTSSFTAISQLDYVLLQVGLALGDANSRITGLQNSLNSTNAQLTSAQNTINSLSGLLYASIAVAIVAVVVAALSVVLLFRRIPKVGGKGGSSEMEESESPKGPEEL